MQNQDLLTNAYTAFNTRDLDTALTLMHPDVDWGNGMEGGRVQGIVASANTGPASGE